MIFITLVTTVVVATVAAVYLKVQLRDAGGRAALWAANRGLTLDARNETLVAGYVKQSQVLRVLGGAVGLALPGAVAVAFGIPNPPLSGAWPFVGYCVGAFYAAAVLVAPAHHERRRAGLVVRELSDYLDHRLIALQRTLPAVVTLAAMLAVLVPYPEGLDRSAGPSVRSVTFGWLAIALAAVVVAELLQRRVVRRAQPYLEPGLAAADDAIRGHIVQTVAGAAVGIGVLATMTILGQLVLSDVQVLRWTMWLPAIFSWVIAVFACVAIAGRPWRVRRREAASP